MPEPDHRLQVLIANERHDRLEHITAIVEGLGHGIVAGSLRIGEVGSLSRSTGAEVAWASTVSTRSSRSPTSFRRQRVPSSRSLMRKTHAKFKKRPSAVSSPTSS